MVYYIIFGFIVFTAVVFYAGFRYGKYYLRQQVINKRVKEELEQGPKIDFASASPGGPKKPSAPSQSNSTAPKNKEKNTGSNEQDTPKGKSTSKEILERVSDEDEEEEPVEIDSDAGEIIDMINGEENE